MDIYEFIRLIGFHPINTDFIKQLEKLYGESVHECVQKVLSVKSEGGLLDSSSILRVLSHSEVLGASKELGVDFVELKLVPVLETGDNDYLVFDLYNRCWWLFNIVDSVRYKQRQKLKEYF